MELVLDISPLQMATAKLEQEKFDAQKTHNKFECPSNYIGLLGEMVFNEYLTQQGIDFEWVEFTKQGWDEADFIIGGKTIDLKTTYSDVMWIQEEKFDIYLYAQINKTEMKFTLKAWLPKEEITKAKISSKGCKIVKREGRKDWIFEPMEMYDIEELSFIKDKKESDAVSFVPIDFPREVLVLSSVEGISGYRLLVKDEAELESYWKGRNGSGNVFFTTYGYRGTQAPKHHRVDYDTPMIHHFVMDFDCKDFRNKGVDVPFEVPHQQVKDLHQYFIKQDIKHYIWFSGGGFHVWITLDRTHNPSSGSAVSRIKHAGRKMVNEWHEMFNLRCNDPGVYFDTARMIRIPNSYNAKRGCWMMPLTTEQIMKNTYEDFMEQSQEPRRGFIQHGNTSIKLNVKEGVEVSFGKIETVDIPATSLSDIHILPCIAQAAMGEGNPPHRARLFFASYLADRLRNFFPHYTVSDKSKKEHIQQISQICGEQGWVDYNPIVTHTQVASIVNTGYSHPTCSTLYMEGFCLGKCKYYDGTGDEI